MICLCPKDIITRIFCFKIRLSRDLELWKVKGFIFFTVEFVLFSGVTGVGMTF